MQIPDHRLLFNAAPCCQLVLEPDLTIVAVSDAYLHVTMTERGGILGRPLFEVFPDDPEDAEADGVANLRASLRRVLLERRPHQMAVQRYPIRRPAAQGGGFEERFWAPVNSPVLHPDGQLAYIIHHVEDVTEVVRLKHERLTQDRNLTEISARTKRYVELLDTAPDATVIVGEDGRIQLINRQAERLFEYARDELIGQQFEVLVPERFRHAHLAHMSRFFANTDARPMGLQRELFMRRKDGSEIPVEVSLSPQQGLREMTVSASVRDITERKRLEAAARLNADRLASAVDSIEDALALFDAEDRLILCNSVYRRLMQETAPGTLVGRSFQDLLGAWSHAMEFADDEARRKFLDERLTRRRLDATSSFDVRLRDGRRLRVIDRRTAEGGIVKTIWDLTTEERRAEELSEARAVADAANSAKSEFLSSMSHELRTPLNAILGFAQLLQRDKREPLSARHHERVGQILHGGQHLLRLIDDVLDLARIEAGKLAMTLESVNMLETLDEVTSTLNPIAARQGIALELEGDRNGLPSVLGDRTRVAQVLLNLGSNAIKYNRPSGRVTFRVTGGLSRVRVSVIDTGIGIPEDQQSKLFQPFHRAGQETGAIEGTGIGLVITKRLLNMMDGDIGFETTPGRGSHFWIDLPVHKEQTRSSTLPSAGLPAAERLRADGTHLVLYVEDNPANIVFMRDLLGTFDNIDLLTMPTAELGIELASARRPAVIIMDINLPRMSGLDALRVLRQLPETKHIPVIALSAAASARDKEQGAQEGFYRYLTKPLKVDELVTALEELLGG